MTLNRKGETMNDIKRIAINTGGGDAPGLNAVIHAAVHAARNHGWEIFGIRDGFDGLLHPENYPDGGLMKLTRPLVRNIEHLGGTILQANLVLFLPRLGSHFSKLLPAQYKHGEILDRADQRMEGRGHCFLVCINVFRRLLPSSLSPAHRRGVAPRLFHKLVCLAAF